MAEPGAGGGGVLAAADRALGRLEIAFVGGAMAFASLLLFVNVVLRYFILAPISWAEELTLYVMVWIVFIGASVAVRTRGHIAIDLLPLVLTPANRHRLAILVGFVVLTFLAAFFYYSSLHTLRVLGIGQVTPVMQAPMWLAYLAMPFGTALMILRTAQHIWRLMRQEKPGDTFAMDLQD